MKFYKWQFPRGSTLCKSINNAQEKSPKGEIGMRTTIFFRQVLVN
jgi:hypothetical protein